MMRLSGSIPVPNHKGDIPKGTLNNILKQAGLKLNLACKIYRGAIHESYLSSFVL